MIGREKRLRARILPLARPLLCPRAPQKTRSSRPPLGLTGGYLSGELLHLQDRSLRQKVSATSDRPYPDA